MNKEEETRYDSALAFAKEKHEGQFRKGGDSYITHPIAVAEILREKGFGIDYQITGLFHDLLEDTDASEAEILSLGNAEILEAVRCLTKTEGYVMADYIDGIRKNEMAYAVKAADRLHNLRCAGEASESFRRRYIAESRVWYLDFDPEIIEAIEALEKTLL
ncbi:MAG: bifunctional (p)ppGpp synthetase/guanosine-3',5'-bis(diphosphate) 3'-pyrophosphohydrolase [Christensenellaceae bacterium]|nr:bifunctional (p)ppGpp synthetase/guanosine-3',5'-bis(diphosphate) 3'-pyrophosphohydrolase [Christensenellaceae bacterium]